MTNPLIYTLQAPIRLYRFILSPLTGNNCRFYPSCSSYALEALEKHGAIKGVLLIIRRIGRCHPWSCGKFHDPVPKRFTWRAFIGYNHPGNPDEDAGKNCKYKKGTQNENV